jgi:hypothetical protein
MISTAQLSEWERLAEAATPGGWYVYTGENDDAIAVAANGVGPNGGWVGIDVAKMPLPGKYKTQEQINANAKLCAAARAAMPALIADLRDAREAFARRGASLESSTATMKEADHLISDLSAENERLRTALKASEGYLLNAKIDLETGAPKRTALNTIEGGLKMVREASGSTS